MGVFLKSGWRWVYTGCVGLTLFAICSHLSCNPEKPEDQLLAETYCGSCHLMPDPGLLDKRTWYNGVLPQMKFRMGYEDQKIWSKIPHTDRAKVYQTMPGKPMISESDWDKVFNYYIKNAPDSLSLKKFPESEELNNFNPIPIKGLQPLVTMLKHDSKSGLTYVGNSIAQLFLLDRSFHKIDSTQLSSTPSFASLEGDTITLALMGIMHPNDQAKGKIMEASVHNFRDEKTIIDSLQRPVFFEKADLDNNGRSEVIVCNFGNYSGSLIIYEPHSGLRQTVLNRLPGARKLLIDDFDKDGLKDILVLMTQGDERLVLYHNDGNLEFSESTLLRFPPVYGSMYFEIHDFNNDGHFDVLYANGDNGDFSVIKKGYHGIRIYINDGENKFKEEWTFSYPGACQASAVDFDQDGDLDIAAISFFPDYKKKEPGFVYFENTGGLSFTLRTTANSEKGRWMVMETADYDLDGDQDILLGALSVKGLGAGSEVVSTWWREGAPLLLLDNKLKHKELLK